MAKIIKMPSRNQPETQEGDPVIALPDPSEESHSLALIKRWLDTADAALAKPEKKKQTA